MVFPEHALGRFPERRPPRRKTRSRFGALRVAETLRRSFGPLLFPRPCCLCDGALADPLASPACPECRSRLRALEIPACRKCGLFFAASPAPEMCDDCQARRRPFRMAVSAAPYDGVFRRALLELKFRRREVLAELLAAPAVLAFRRARSRADGPPPAAVLPAPLPYWRGMRRGFNQAELLARPVAEALGIPLVQGLLKRRGGAPQTTVSPSRRRSNVGGVFRARRLPPRLVDRPLLLVDDVFTTGSTVEAATRCLLRAGADAVDVLTAARAI